MAIRNVVTRGFGAGAAIAFVVTHGYSLPPSLPTAADRIVTVLEETRTITVATEARIVTVLAETRSVTVTDESRIVEP